MVRSQQERKSKRAALDHDGGTEMTGVIEHRDPALVREELADLARYLNGVPEEIRSTGAFGAYDQRAGELSRELILAELRTLPIPDDRKGTVNPDSDEFSGWRLRLSALAQRRVRIARLTVRASHTVIVSGAVALVLMVVIAPYISLGWPPGAIALSLLFCVGWLAERARKQERTAERLNDLLAEISHSFGPAGEVLRPSEYYSASTERIELLLDEIRAGGKT